MGLYLPKSDWSTTKLQKFKDDSDGLSLIFEGENKFWWDFYAAPTSIYIGDIRIEKILNDLAITEISCQDDKLRFVKYMVFFPGRNNFHRVSESHILMMATSKEFVEQIETILTIIL